MRNRSNRIHQTDDHPPKNGRIITPHCPGQIQEIIMAKRTGYSDGHPVVHIDGTKLFILYYFSGSLFGQKKTRYIFRAAAKIQIKQK